MTKLITIILLMTLTLNISAQKNDDRGYIVKIGDMAPDFKIKEINGEKYKLSDLKGKVVMLQFTASWCGVCRYEMPFIEEQIWQELKSNTDFALIGIDKDEELDKITPFIKSTGVTYPIAFDIEAKIFQLYAAKNAGITRNVIIDRDGKIIYLTRLYDKKEFAEMKQVIFNELKK